jgi:hypothetical protein
MNGGRFRFVPERAMQAVISIRNRPAGTSRPVCFCGKLRGLENDAEKVESRLSEKISSSKTLFVKLRRSMR